MRSVFIALLLLASTLSAAEATGGLRYSITVTKFENKAGWSGRFDVGEAWATVMARTPLNRSASR